MRRLIILFYWFFRAKHNVGFRELLKFLAKPQVTKIAHRYIKEIIEGDGFYIVSFNSSPHRLYWPMQYPVDGIYQVTAETFDNNDWHFYQKKQTEVVDGEILLDVGAAEGLFSLTVAHKCQKLLLVEPNDHFHAALKRTFKPYADKVKIFNAAAGAENGKIIFDSNSLIGKVSTSNQEGVTKPLAKVDDLVGDTPVTYIKADLEGFEIQMLKGAERTIRCNKPKMAITVYHKENDLTEIVNLIKRFVPEYQYYVKGVTQTDGKPVMIHFWVAKP